jgi:nitrate/nitrite transporter NarK
MKIFGREPALILGFIAAAVQSLFAFGINVSPGVQTAVNAIAAAVVGIASAVVLKNGALGAALMQLATAGMALVVGLGLNWDTDKQGWVMALVAAGIALFTRTQVTPPVPSVKLEKSSPLKAA